MKYGRYELSDILGKGGMADVYLAIDPNLARQVAVKIIRSGQKNSDTLEQRFSIEARACAALHHPNIIAVHDFGTENGDQYLVMEYVNGPNLHDLIEANPKGLSEICTAALIQQAAEGLAEAHKHGIIHRDIKPENMLISNDGLLKITDFGIARSVADSSLTQTGELMGSPKFMSPEQIEGDQVDASCDLFSLGCVLYYCLSGKSPFESSNATATMFHIVQNPTPKIKVLRPNIDDFWDEILVRLLEKKPVNRSLTASKLAEELHYYLNRKMQIHPKQLIQDLLTSSGLHSIVHVSSNPTEKSGNSKFATSTDNSRNSQSNTNKIEQLILDKTKKKNRSVLLLFMGFFCFVALMIGLLWFIFQELPSLHPVQYMKLTQLIENKTVDSIEANAVFDSPSLSKNLIQKINSDQTIAYPEILEGFSQSLSDPKQLIGLALAARDYDQRRSHQSISNSNIRLSADYYLILGYQASKQFSAALQASTDYMEWHPNTQYYKAVEAIHSKLIELKADGVF